MPARRSDAPIVLHIHAVELPRPVLASSVAGRVMSSVSERFTHQGYVTAGRVKGIQVADT
jgi:hypothetical protein